MCQKCNQRIFQFDESVKNSINTNLKSSILYGGETRFVRSMSLDSSKVPSLYENQLQQYEREIRNHIQTE